MYTKRLNIITNYLQMTCKAFVRSLDQPGYYTNECTRYLKTVPNLNSPKLPQPIFFPTLKLGPTIKTPDEEVDAVELLLCRVPVPPPTAEFDDCIVLGPPKALQKKMKLEIKCLSIINQAKFTGTSVGS